MIEEMKALVAIIFSPIVLLLLIFLLPASAGAVSAPSLLSALPVKSEQNTGYDRDLFDHWIDADSNGCDTRDEVLLRQDKAPGAVCNAATGRWHSAYDGVTLTTSSSLDIDHFIPLAEGWGSGAGKWSSAKRERYANDLYGYSLIAVSASSNRSKGDSDPSEWLPPLLSFRCKYLARWVAVKYRWGLSVDSTEKSAIRSAWASCSRSSLDVTKIKKAS